jgi:hypothetical protein
MALLRAQYLLRLSDSRLHLSCSKSRAKQDDDKRHTVRYLLTLKPFHWNAEKNEQLLSERAIGFESIVIAIQDGGLLDVRMHPNTNRYPNQRLLLVEVDLYVYLVPVVEEPDYYFLKTIIPSRKATQEYAERTQRHDPTQ